MSVQVDIPNRGPVESATLTRALVDLASRGERPHCSDPGTSELWLSGHKAERAEAAKLCRGCPVIEPCGQAATARRERWGVWAGVDRTVRPGPKAQA
jgi:hypothetical protein